ncbi:maleamate amidohydrolase [Amorphus suaedae]
MTADTPAEGESQALASKMAGLISDQEKQVMALAGYGRRGGLGSRPALLVVDVTYGFCGRSRRPVLEAVADERRACGEAAWNAVPRIAELIRRARVSRVPVVYSAMTDPASPEFEPGLWPLKNSRGGEAPGQIPPGQGDNEIIAEIAPLPGEMVYAKGKPSIFAGTGILAFLIARRVDTLIVCGGTTSGCVYASVVDAFSNNFRTAVVADACFDRIETLHWAFLLDVDFKYGDVVTSEMATRYIDDCRSR